MLFLLDTIALKATGVENYKQMSDSTL